MTEAVSENPEIIESKKLDWRVPVASAVVLGSLLILTGCAEIPVPNISVNGEALKQLVENVAGFFWRESLGHAILAGGVGGLVSARGGRDALLNGAIVGGLMGVGVQFAYCNPDVLGALGKAFVQNEAGSVGTGALAAGATRLAIRREVLSFNAWEDYTESAGWGAVAGLVGGGLIRGGLSQGAIAMLTAGTVVLAGHRLFSHSRG